MPKALRPLVTGEQIDFEQLDEVVTKQLEADAKYDREDAAKFRAVKQKVATYEEFEAIVDGSHLKPMTEDVAAIEFKKSLFDRSGRSKTRARRRANETHVVKPTTAAPDTAPDTVQSFLRAWRHRCPTAAAKAGYLLLIGAEAAGTLFAAEVPDGLLGPFLLALDQAYDPAAAAETYALLHALSTTARYELAVEFLTGPESEAAGSLLGKLGAAGVAVPAAADPIDALTALQPPAAGAAGAAGEPEEDIAEDIARLGSGWVAAPE